MPDAHAVRNIYADINALLPTADMTAWELSAACGRNYHRVSEALRVMLEVGEIHICGRREGRRVYRFGYGENFPKTHTGRAYIRKNNPSAADRILKALGDKTMTVTELTEVVFLARATIKHACSVMREHGALVVARYDPNPHGGSKIPAYSAAARPLQSEVRVD